MPLAESNLAVRIVNKLLQAFCVFGKQVWNPGCIYQTDRDEISQMHGISRAAVGAVNKAIDAHQFVVREPNGFKGDLYRIEV